MQTAYDSAVPTGSSKTRRLRLHGRMRESVASDHAASVSPRLRASRVRCAGLRPPLTRGTGAPDPDISTPTGDQPPASLHLKLDRRGGALAVGEPSAALMDPHTARHPRA